MSNIKKQKNLDTTLNNGRNRDLDLKKNLPAASITLVSFH